MNDPPILIIKTLPNPMILLHPHIPKPLWGINPRNLFGRENWDIWRRAAYRYWNYKCFACGHGPKTSSIYTKHAGKNRPALEAHEVFRYDLQNAVATFEGIVALCHLCHGYIHRLRLQAGTRCKANRKKKKATDLLNAVADHGYNVLNSVDPKSAAHKALICRLGDTPLLSQKSLLAELPYGPHVQVHGYMLPGSVPKDNWVVNIMGQTINPKDHT